MRDLLPDDGARERAPHDRQLVAEASVQRLEPARHLNGGKTAPVRDCVAAVEVELVRGGDPGVPQVLVRGVERVVDLERGRSRAARAGAGDADVSYEVAGIAAGGLAVDAVAACARA